MTAALDDAPNELNPLHLVIQTFPPPLDRGVYTGPQQSIPVGTLIEESPVLIFTQEEWLQNGRHTVLQHYTFVWGKTGKMAIALGMGESCSVCSSEGGELERVPRLKASAAGDRELLELEKQLPEIEHNQGFTPMIS